MKLKVIFGVMSILFIIFTILLFIPEKKNFKIITSPKVFSIFRTSENESFNIHLLVNQDDTYYFDNDYISKISLNSELDQEIIPLSLEEANYGSEIYIYENENYYFVDLSFKIGFNSDEYLVQFEEAYLNIDYNSDEEIKVYIGEFNYLFDNAANKDISINNMFSTVLKTDDFNNISGVFIEIKNLSDENLVIKEFNLGSEDVVFNNYYLSQIFNVPDLFDNVEDILLIDEYNYITFNNDETHEILLNEGEKSMFYVPVSFIGDIKYIHRFYFEIFYETNEGIKKIIVDDFPFINTSIYQESLEKDYIFYEIPHKD